jgi:hypothetical protein
MMQRLLRAIGMAPVRPPAPADDQTHSEAALDNAIVDVRYGISRLCEAAAVGSQVDAKLRAGIDRMKISGADPIEVMARVTGRRH